METTYDQNDKIAWVLAGGGSRGAYQVAVMEDLINKNYHPSVIVGTSVGALNGAGYYFQDIPALKSMWLGIDGRSDVFSLNLNPFKGGIFNAKPLRKMIRKMTTHSPHTGTECIACYTDLNTGNVKYSSSLIGSREAFRTAIEASASIPVIVEPVLGRYVDGGVRENCPLSYAIKRKCKKIIVVLCSPVDPILLSKHWARKKDIAIRSFDLISHEMVVNDIDMCKRRNRHPHNSDKQIDLMVIQPPRRYNRGTLDFSRESIQEGFYYGSNWALYGDERWHRV